MDLSYKAIQFHGDGDKDKKTASRINGTVERWGKW
jgi:hypothetical protein